MPDISSTFKVANYWKNSGRDITCFLCPRFCRIEKGKSGLCNVRYNHDGQLYSLVYGYPNALQIDPIEKKPLAEFMPSTYTFSIGTFGCNLECLFCQNHQLSRGKPALLQNNGKYYSPEFIVEQAVKHKCKSVAFTYNEPTVWIEYAIDIAKQAKDKNLGVVLVSNGYVNREPSEDFYKLVDAANIDMKAFSDSFYNEMTNGKLEPVLDSIKYLYSLKKHIELTNLVIPGKNDSELLINRYLDWVEQNLNKSIPLHFSAYHPMYNYKQSPRTPVETLYWIRSLAEGRGFNSVYLGNI